MTRSKRNRMQSRCCTHVALLGVAPADATVIGDSENDVLSARAAGCSVIVVETGYNEGKSLSELDADAIVPTLLHAARLIEPQPL